MTFAEIIPELLEGKKLTRVEWESDDCIFMKDAQLVLKKEDDSQLHVLIVSAGDLQGTDWIVA